MASTFSSMRSKAAMAESVPMLPTALWSCRGLRCLSAGFEHVLFGFGLSDLALKGDETLLQGLDLTVPGLEPRIQGRGGFLEGLTPGECFSGQAPPPPFQGQFSPLAPGRGLRRGLLSLTAKPPTGDSDRYR